MGLAVTELSQQCHTGRYKKTLRACVKIKANISNMFLDKLFNRFFEFLGKGDFIPHLKLKVTGLTTLLRNFENKE